jgi:type IV pilus assembly protein PilF
VINTVVFTSTFLALSLLVGCSSGPSKKDRAILHLNMGTSLLNNGNSRAALRELRQAEKYDSDNAIVQNNLGLAYYMLEETVLAEKHIRKAIEISDEYTDAHNNLSRVLIDLGRFEDAQKHAKTVIKDLTYSSPEKGWINLGLSYFFQKKYKQSLVPFQKALKYDEKNCFAQTMMGRSYFELEQFQEAARVLDWGSKYCTESGTDEPLYYAGLAYYKAGEKEKALARMDDLLRLHPHGKYAAQASSMRKLME